MKSYVMKLVKLVGMYDGAKVIAHSIRRIHRLRISQKICERTAAIQRRQRMQAFYSQFIWRTDLCFDIGANISDWSEAFLRLGANVVAVEPDDEYRKAIYPRTPR